MSEEEEYILKWIEEEDLRSRAIGYRKGAKPDMRFYIMGLLHYKYDWTENRIAKLLGMSQASSVNHGKVKPYEMRHDPTFIKHTRHLKAAFPFKFPDPHNTGLHEKRIRLTGPNYDKFREFRKKHGCRSDSKAMNELIDLFL